MVEQQKDITKSKHGWSETGYWSDIVQHLIVAVKTGTLLLKNKYTIKSTKLAPGLLMSLLSSQCKVTKRISFHQAACVHQLIKWKKAHI
jgi:ribosomal protein L30E